MKLEELIDVQNGFAFKSNDFIENGIPVIKIKNIISPLIDLTDTVYIPVDKFDEYSNYAIDYNDILISLTGSGINQPNSIVGKVGRYRHLKKSLLNQRVAKIYSKDRNVLLDDYLFYFISQREVNMSLATNSTGSANQANISPKHIKNLIIKLPSKLTQEKICIILNTIFDKIENNNITIKLIEQISQTLFKRWFIDFEFPNEDGKPYKSSGGEMVESELGEIPKGWSTGIIKDYYENFDSKRKPLSKLERSKREKIYRYYGAGSLMDFVDDYIFDGIYLLMGEDGTVKTEEGMPVLQYVYGKFWVNNHAHVMQGKNGFTTEYLYLLLKRTNITNIITGAVQPKISQGNLNKIKVIKPTDDILEEFNKLIKVFFEEIRNLNDEVKNLEILRDTLLPKLLSGEIEIPEDLEV